MRSMGEVGIEIEGIKELIIHRAKDYQSILSAIRVQDSLRRKVSGKETTDIIREWRDNR